MREFFKYTLAVVCGLMLFGILKFIMLLSMIITLAAGSETTTTAKAGSVYELELVGSLVERTDEDAFVGALMEAMDQGDSYKEFGLNDILSNIRKAKTNPNIDGIYLHGGTMQMGYASAQEIRDALIDFKQSGKYVVAYADSYLQSNYYVASVADRLLVNADGSLSWQGLGATIGFYTRMLEKIGVEMQVVKVGTFKSAVEPFMLTEMSDANRLQYNTLLGDMWQKICADVAESRAISVDSLNMLADLSMTLQPQSSYVQTRMVDALGYDSDVDSILLELSSSNDYHLLTYNDMVNLPTSSSHVRQQVAVLYAEGDITDSEGDGIVGKEMVETIADLMDDDDIKAVVLRVNSGGGSAYASEQIHHALCLLRAKKPLVVSMGDYAASGGYYISCPANYIFAEETTLTGSIGIFGLIPCVKGLTEKIGMDVDGVSTHRHSDLETNMVYKGMNPEERALMQAEINRGYDLFTRRCAEGRGMSQDSIRLIGEGRVWSGTRAIEIGLVDKIGSLADAIVMAAELAELEDYELAEYPEPEDIWTSMLEELSANARVERILQKRMGAEAYQTMRYMEQLQNGFSLQARVPYIVSIK